MARPTKKQLENRKKLINLRLLVRDSPIYTDFEEQTKNLYNFEKKSKKLSKSRLSYAFCGECHKRSFAIDENLLNGFKNEKNLMGKHENRKELEEKLTILRDISPTSSFYLLNVILRNYTKSLQEKNYKPYRLEEVSLKLKKWEQYTIPNTIRLIYNNFTPFNPYRITDSGFKNEDLKQTALTNSVFIEFDLSKDKKEILEYISLIKDDYDENPNNIYNHEFKPYKCELETCEIYKNKEPKPINGRLADVLFIYDCRKIGLHDEYIIDEINNYWIENKKNSAEKIYQKTIQNYHKFAIDYIENEKYKYHVSGYDLNKK